MRLTFASVMAGALALAGAAHAQLAVVTAHAPDDAVQGYLVSAVVEAALTRWEALSPQLLNEDLRSCPANDAECLRELSRKRGATHLLVVGVAPLGPRDAVVSAQLFSVGDEAPLFEGTAVQPGDSGGDDDGRSDVRELSRRLVAISGPPPAQPHPQPPPPEPATSDMGVLGLVGVGAVGVGAVGAGVTAILAAQKFTGARDYSGVVSMVVIGGSLSGAVLLAGVALLTAENL